MFYSYQRKKELVKLYENKPNELCKIFMKAGYTEDKIIALFQNQSKEEIINQILTLLEYRQFNEEIKEYYSIPLKYKQCEWEYLKEDVEEDFTEMNHSIDKKLEKHFPIYMIIKKMNILLAFTGQIKLLMKFLKMELK